MPTTFVLCLRRMIYNHALPTVHVLSKSHARAEIHMLQAKLALRHPIPSSSFFAVVNLILWFILTREMGENTLLRGEFLEKHFIFCTFWPRTATPTPSSLRHMSHRRHHREEEPLFCPFLPLSLTHSLYHLTVREKVSPQPASYDHTSCCCFLFFPPSSQSIDRSIILWTLNYSTEFHVDSVLIFKKV